VKGIAMNESEQLILEELKKELKGKFHKACVDAYLKNPIAVSIVKVALEKLEKASQ
jgi:hypothetical protein